MADDKKDQTHLLTWLGVVLSVLSIVVTLLLPGTQTWLCRKGLRLACDTGEMKITDVTFRHQYLPHSADATIMLDVLKAQSVHAFSDRPSKPIHCDESVDYVMSNYENVYKASYGNIGLIRGNSDYIMMDIDLSFPSSDEELQFDIDITMQAPKRQGNVLWPEFGLHPEPSKQSLSVLSKPNTEHCKATFLLIPFNDAYGTSTANWPEGEYIVNVSLSGSIQAYEQKKFTLR